MENNNIIKEYETLNIVFDRMIDMSDDSLNDFFELIKICRGRNISRDELREVHKTMWEIFFPESIGKIKIRNKINSRG